MNKKIILVLILVAMVMIGSASDPERAGNPHIDDNVTVEVFVYPEVVVQHNSTMEIPDINVTVNVQSTANEYNPDNINPLIIQDETIVSKQMIEEFMHNQGFVLFFEYKDPQHPNEIIYMDQCWARPGAAGFTRVKLSDNVILDSLILDIHGMAGNFVINSDI